jgi:hypothetical protein
MAREEEVLDTSDYKLDKHGKKIKAHRIVFNKGEDDGKKGVSEQMKKTFSTFVEQHTPELTEEQLNELVAELQEVLGKDQPAGKWISDFVHSDNPKFAGKSKEKRKQMALAAYYSSQRNEELKGGQVKLDKNKNGKLDKQDFKLLRKEELDEALHPEADKVLKHIKPEHQAKYKPDLAKGVYKGDYADRTAVLKAAKAAGHLNEESEQIDEAIHADDYIATSEKSKMDDGHRPHVVNKSTGKTMHLSQHSYKSAEHAKQHAQAYLSGYAKMGPNAADRHAHEFYKANKDKLVKESAWDYKSKRAEGHKAGDVTSTKHEVSKSASGGTIYKKQHDDQGISKEFKRDPDTAKRGRGRPKKNAFGEAVEFLMSLDETTFDSFMEEGFDAFMETYENLDEVSKATLGSYIKKASRDAVVTRKIGSDFENMANKSRKPSSKAAATQLADKYKAKS